MNINFPVKVLPTRVYRVYKGGFLLDKFRGEKEPKDTNYPEDWICSTVRALLADGSLSKDSISKIKPVDGKENIEELIDLYPEDILGEGYIKQYGKSLNILVKLLDSAIRLPLQCHPEKSFSRKYLNSGYGKAEAWFILETRKIRENPYILLGFREKVSKRDILKLVEQDDSDELVYLMNKVEVKPYDTYFIAPGLPHAIGEGVFMVETQEPTDFTISVERKCGDIVSSDEKCTLRLGWDIALDALDYTPYTIEEVKERFGTKKELTYSSNTGKIYSLNGGSYMKSCFRVLFLKDVKDIRLSFDSFASLVVVGGKGIITSQDGEFPIERGETYIIPAGFGEHRYIGEEPLEIIVSLPPQGVR